MGSSSSKPEFDTVLANQQVQLGQNISLHCKANMNSCIATWEKNGHRFDCVEGKHKVQKNGTTCSLEIANVQEDDEGNYTLNLKNKHGSSSCSAMVIVEIKEWRTVLWSQKPMLSKLQTFKIGNDAVRELRFLLYGPVGAGKSSTINTIKSIFEGRQFINCLSAAGSSKSQTIYYQKFSLAQKDLFPFAFNDIMGVEEETCKGVCTEDIISALKGHVKEGHMFIPGHPLREGNFYYRENPTLGDKIHCLVNIIPADKLALIKEDFIQKMKAVREKASEMGLPQVVLLTRVDHECPITKANLRNVYKSKKIRNKVRECSNVLGVPANCIFPVSNYHEETGINDNINCLMLDGLTQMVDWANDYVVQCSSTETHVE